VPERAALADLAVTAVDEQFGLAVPKAGARQAFSGERDDGRSQ
jgi:hypothetical protein